MWGRQRREPGGCWWTGANRVTISSLPPPHRRRDLRHERLEVLLLRECHRRLDAGFAAPEPEGDRGVLGTVVGVVDGSPADGGGALDPGDP